MQNEDNEISVKSNGELNKSKSINTIDQVLDEITTSAVQPKENACSCSEQQSTSNEILNYKSETVIPPSTDVQPTVIDVQPTVEQTSSIQSIGSLVCRICHNAEHPEFLISPCLCKGTLSYVHINCLEHWLSTSGILQCEVCRFQFRTERTLRYTCLQSLELWYSHPNNRGSLQADFLICSLLTVVTFGLISVSLMGMQYYIAQGSRFGISNFWTQGAMAFFLGVIVCIFVYGANIYLILKSQLQPWYRWWQTARNVKLILENHPRNKVRDSEAGRLPSSPQPQNEFDSDEIEVQTTTFTDSLEVESNESNDNQISNPDRVHIGPRATEVVVDIECNKVF